MMTTAIQRPARRTSTTESTSVDFVRNAALLGLLWATYAVVRGITAGDLVTATENAHRVIELQRSLGLPSEEDLQAAVLDQPWLLKCANVYYIGVHFPITIGFLVWVYRTHRPEFVRMRNALIATTGAGLFIHVIYPLKPPRMMAGFVDTAAVLGPDPYALGVSGGANQLAAMPSLHVGWALLIALGTVWIVPSKAKWLSMAHPAVTLAVVVLTANHYWVDALAAIAIVAAVWRFLPGSASHGPRLVHPDQRRASSRVRPCAT